MKEALFKHWVIAAAATFAISSALGACSSHRKNDPVDEGQGGSGGSGGSGGTGGEGGDPGNTGGTGGSGGSGSGADSGGSGGGTAAECQSNSDCDGDQLCDPFLDKCVECLYDSDCANGQQCLRESCTSIVDCGNSLDCPDDQVCDTARERCVECLSDADCGDDAVCENNLCEAVESCSNSLDCTGTQVCDTSRDRCVRCVSSSDCPAAGTVCGFNSCRPTCSSDTQCRGLGMLCDTNYGFCARCVTGNDCPTAYHCNEGSCRLDVCEPGSAYCAANVLYECNAAGSGYTGTSCGSGQSCLETNDYEASCKNQVCTPGATECDGSFENIIECSDDGLEILDTVGCGDQICYQGACEDLVCPPSSYFCDAETNTVQYCASDGQSSSTTDYCVTDSEYCNPSTAACEPLLCQPDQPACDGTVATTCNSAGDGYESGGTDCADSEQACVVGECADCNNTVLFLGSSSDTTVNSAFETALANAGLYVQTVAGQQNYSGTPDASGFGAVLVYMGTDYSTDMPTAGQTSIVNAQAAGTGFVVTAYAGYTVSSLGYWTSLSNIVIEEYVSATSSNEFTLTSANHPIWTGLPTTFTTSYTLSITQNYLVNSGTSIATCTGCSDSSYPAGFIAVREGSGGRIVHLPFMNYQFTYEPNMMTILANSVQWASACL